MEQLAYRSTLTTRGTRTSLEKVIFLREDDDKQLGDGGTSTLVTPIQWDDGSHHCSGGLEQRMNKDSEARASRNPPLEMKGEGKEMQNC